MRGQCQKWDPAAGQVAWLIRVALEQWGTAERCCKHHVDASGWAYVPAEGAVCNQTDAVPDRRLLLARRISLQSQDLAALINDVHAYPNGFDRTTSYRQHRQASDCLGISGRRGTLGYP